MLEGVAGTTAVTLTANSTAAAATRQIMAFAEPRVATNVVPDHCEATIDRRTLPEESPQAALADLVVVRGPNEAGKSTLFNALVGRDAAVVSPVAGTTRDALAKPAAWAGAAFELFDTGGMFGASDDPLHELVIRQGQRALVIGGSGKMGRWFAEFLDSQGFEVTVADPAGPVAGFRHAADCRQLPEAFAVTVVATPLGITAEILTQLAGRSHRGLIFDIGSLKSPLIAPLRALAAGGAWASGVTGVWPTNTRPSHASLLTGVAPAGLSCKNSGVRLSPEKIATGCER